MFPFHTFSMAKDITVAETFMVSLECYEAGKLGSSDTHNTNSLDSSYKHLPKLNKNLF
jgi:hypothetical protein